MALGAALFVAGVVAGIVQLWFALWSAATFLKIEMTLGGILVIVIVLWYVVREYKEDKANRSGDQL